MSVRKKGSEKGRKTLTEVELEMMRVLWQLGEGTVSDVQSRLPQDRKLAYTSVSTMLRILEQKGMVTSRKEGRGHIYEPLLDRETYGKQTVEDLVHKVFGGAPTAMVRTLLDIDGLSESDLQAIRKLIDDKGRPS
jgi:predicted transcriptional regulator